MMRYEELNLHTELGRILNVVSDHAKELYGPSNNLDINHMSAVVAAGLARGYVVYSNDIVVGYALMLLGRDLFRAHIRTAECVAVYIQPAHRNGIVASRLLSFASMRLEQEAINQVVITANNDKRLVKYYERLGFSQSNIQMTKEI